MQLPQPAEADSSADADIPPDLGRAGAVVEKAIDYMIEQNMVSISIASALLGGALGMLARSLDDTAIVQILNSAILGVQAGDLQRDELVRATPASGCLNQPGQN